MATSKVNVTEGLGKVVATYSITEDAVTKELQRVVPSDSSGNPGTVGNIASGVTDSGNPVKTGGVYNSSAPTFISGQRGDDQLDINGNKKVTLGTLLAGEDLTVNVIKVEERFSYSYIAGVDTLVKSGSGFIHTLTFTQIDAVPTAGTIIVYDNTAESGNIIFSSTWTTAIFYPTTVTIDATFTTGLYIGYTTTADIGTTVSYR